MEAFKLANRSINVRHKATNKERKKIPKFEILQLNYNLECAMV
jgi:hypothetical protein